MPSAAARFAAALVSGVLGLTLLAAAPASAVEDGADVVDTSKPTLAEQAAAILPTAKLPEARAVERIYAAGLGDARDRKGYERSLYRGKWYMPKREAVRRCIMRRESWHNYRAHGGRWHGAYQMSRSLARGATWEMQPEVRREFGDEGVKILRQLRTTPTWKWNRYWQDRAFWTIWRNGKGKGHWRGGDVACFKRR